MDKQQARSLIKNTFEKPFDKGRFTLFVKNLLNQIDNSVFTYQGNYIPDAYKQYISTLERVGKYTDGKHKIDILIVHLQKKTSIERARTMQRNFIAWYLNGSRGGEMKDASLVAFVSPDEENWRFSLVKMEYKFVPTDSGKVKTREELTPARRYSFLVGKNEPNHTAQQQLVPLLQDDENNPTLTQLEAAFNIETVTKEFFGKYRELFFLAKETLDTVVSQGITIKADFELKGVNTIEFAKKLLGQIVFLYFLQKKGWFGVQRDNDWGTGPKNFLRELFEKKHGKYTNFFNDILEPLFYEALARERDRDFYSRFNCKIPFLNGGLFDPIGNYDWVHIDILLPNELFSNTIKTKEGDTGNGILDIFDRYNFTVKEDEPLEREVAVDPEMLGKVFENLLEVKDRKSKGTYYTPREIVHYMCQQSLINYLTTEINGKVTKDDLEKLIKYGENVAEYEATYVAKKEDNLAYDGKYGKPMLHETVEKYAQEIDEKLANIKVCDPAIGSGAFPVGMMNEIVKARNVLTNYTVTQPSWLSNNHKQDACDTERTPYNFKRQCIEKSIYGVDIDPGAVEIAKLRLWLSLVVDEEDMKTIKPLPNLDYKIVCGNSLLGVEKDLFNSGQFNELERLKPLLFNETSPEKKREHKKQIDDLIHQITNGHKEFDFEIYFSEVFHEKKGFDVVIGNPPYGNLLKEQEKKLIKDIYLFSTFSDISSPFIERGFSLLKNSGNLVFIITYAITFNKDFSKSRELISNSFENSYIYTFDRDKCRTFESMTQSVSIIKCFNKNPLIKKGVFTSRIFRNTPDIHHIEVCNCDRFLLPKGITYKQKHRLPKIGEDLNKQILIKLFSFNDRVENIIKGRGEKIWIRTSGNYWYNAFDKKPYNSCEISPLDVNKNFANFLIVLINSSLFYFWFRIYGDGRHMNSDILESSPLPSSEKILKYNVLLDKMKNRFMERLFSVFDKERNRFITSKIKSEIDLLDLILGKYFYGLDYEEINHIFNYDLEIRGGNKSPQPFIALVDQILAITKDNDYLDNPIKQVKVKEYEHQIDQLVYQLYNLTDEEIAIVEGKK